MAANVPDLMALRKAAMFALHTALINSEWSPDGNDRVYIYCKIKFIRNRFQIVTIEDNATDYRAMLEGFRVDFMELNSRFVGRSDELRWDHLVELFWVMEMFHNSPPNIRDSFRKTTPNYPQFQLDYSADVTAWFRAGMLPDGMKAHLMTPYPWFAKLTMDRHPSGIRYIIPREERIFSAEGNAERKVHDGSSMREDSGAFKPLSDSLVVNNYTASGEADSRSIGCPAYYTSPTHQASIKSNGHFFAKPVAEIGHSLLHSQTSALSYQIKHPHIIGSGASSLNSTVGVGCQETEVSGSLHIPDPSADIEKGLIRSPNTFIPCRILLSQERTISPDLAIRAHRAGVPMSKYLGEITEKVIENRLLPENENCSLRITNLHPLATNQEVFATIRTGRVYHYHRVPPTVLHKDCTFNLVFMERRGAEHYLRQCQSPYGIVIHGKRLYATWNRDKYKPTKSGNLSRVVRVCGPKKYVPVAGLAEFSIKGLKRFFVGKFFYTLIEEEEWDLPGTKDRKAVQFSFGSILSQGEMCQMSLSRFFKANKLQSQFKVTYEPDPCNDHFRY